MSSTRHRHLPHLAPFAQEPLVFLTVVTRNRDAVLANPLSLKILHGVWERSAESNGWWVGDYLLMPDHVHLFARASRGANSMAAWVRMWKSVSSRQIQCERRAQGSLWQKDYFDRFVRCAENYAEKWAYVEANPVRAGLVLRAEVWPYRGRIHCLAF